MKLWSFRNILQNATLIDVGMAEQGMYKLHLGGSES